MKKKESLVSRVFESQEAFEMAFKDVEDIFVDGTEIGIKRAINNDIQRKSYSEKNHNENPKLDLAVQICAALWNFR